MYGLPRKFGVGQIYLQLWQLNFPTRPSANELAREVNVGWHYAAKVISEIHLNDEIMDPAEICLGKNIERGVGNNLTPGEDLFRLSLHAEIPNRPIWIIVKSCLPTMVLSSHCPLFRIISPRLGPTAVSTEKS
jgi:hypothetical protein